MGTGIVIGALLLTGCSSKSDEEKSKASAGETVQSPLEKRLPYLFDFTVDQEERQAHNLRRETALAECMKDQGFEYTPNIFEDVDHSIATPSDEPQVNTLRYAEKYGYEFFINPASVNGYVNDPDEYVYTNPDQEYFDSLSESEQQDYLDALDGPPEPPELDAEQASQWLSNPENQGCYGIVSTQVFDYTRLDFYNESIVVEFSKDLENLPERYLQDPTIVALNETWAQCLTSKGYNYNSPAEAKQGAQDSYDEVYQITRTADGYESNTQASDEAVAKATKEEIALATADYQCRDKTGYTKVFQTAQKEIEEAYIVEHSDTIAEIEALYASIEN